MMNVNVICTFIDSFLYINVLSRGLSCLIYTRTRLLDLLLHVLDVVLPGLDLLLLLFDLVVQHKLELLQLLDLFLQIVDPPLLWRGRNRFELPRVLRIFFYGTSIS